MAERHKLELDTAQARGVRWARGIFVFGCFFALLSPFVACDELSKGNLSDALKALVGGLLGGVLFCGVGQVWHWIVTGQWMGEDQWRKIFAELRRYLAR